MRTLTTSKPENLRGLVDLSFRSFAIAAPTAMMFISLAILVSIIFPDYILGEGRTARLHVIETSARLSIDTTKRAFEQSEIHPAELAEITASAPDAFEFKSCDRMYSTEYRSVWKCRYNLHITRPFEIHISEVLRVHVRKNAGILSTLFKESDVISVKTDLYPRVVETFGIAPEAER